ncbi:unnamed protein product [Thlaspi arvense]|uniref:Uncharacterized protein n=1 Tax=Thlaspi arvense TaxID=13288 RepID=A0AAU9T105_THLAR|nr:unnamed protein product [Thlaspi arvense]
MGIEPDELEWRGPEGRMVSKEVNGLDSLKESLLPSRLRHFDRELEDIWDEKKISRGTTLESW